jgi:serine/threonine protein kinase
MPAVDDFLKTILRSGLLDREHLQAALRTVPQGQRGDPQALAEHLVRNGKLSRFQARKLLEGTALGLKLGPFQVLAPVGKGGMGTVYLARDSRSDQLLALKVLPPKRAREEERILARFRREMEMCYRVAHPNLAWTYEVGVCQGVYFIAMEFIPGNNLFNLVSKEGPLPVPRAARLFAEVASALEHAHMQGLIHRDLKPSNIVITPNDHAKVLDLGLALMQGEIPTDRTVVGGQGYVVGSMDYIAPEQAEDASKADPRSDIYGLGCTLYFVLTGRPPFPGGKAQDKIQCHRTQEPVPINELNPNVPAGFIEVVRKMTAKRPEERFASAAEVQEELEKWLAGEPVRPMDQRGDEAYQHAVAALEAASFDEADRDPVWAEARPDGEGNADPPASGPIELPPPTLPRSPALDWWLLGSIGLGTLVLIILAVLLLTL